MSDNYNSSSKKCEKNNITTVWQITALKVRIFAMMVAGREI
jgi:hypothetical protein